MFLHTTKKEGQFEAFGCSFDGRNELIVSFVGMKICSDGIVAITDSKASREKNYQFYEDVKRGRIQKVFKNNNFILITHGYNEIQKDGNIIYIEDWINEHIGCLTYEEFLIKFCNENQQDKKEFHFIVGYKENNQYCVSSVTVQGDKYIINYKRTDKLFYFGGDNKYINMFSQMNLTLLKDVQSSKEDLETLLTEMIHIFDYYDDYNSVGLPVQIEIFQ